MASNDNDNNTGEWRDYQSLDKVADKDAERYWAEVSAAKMKAAQDAGATRGALVQPGVIVVGSAVEDFTTGQIARMSEREYQRHRGAILRAMREGRVTQGD